MAFSDIEAMLKTNSISVSALSFLLWLVQFLKV